MGYPFIRHLPQGMLPPENTKIHIWRYDMRKKLRIVLALMLTLSLLAASPVFAAGDEATAAADALNALGLFQGTGEGYELDRAPTRAEALVMLIRLLGRESEAKGFSGDCPLEDVAGRWMAPYVGWAYEHGITKGVSDDAFDPNSAANAQMYATFMLRALEYSEELGHFSYKTSVKDAAKLGIAPVEGYSGEFTRGDAVLMSYKALTAPCAGGEGSLLELLISKGTVDAEVAASLGFAVASEEPEAEWAPDISFTTVDMDGNTVTDAVFGDAKLTMINYWAYWCGPCVREMPDLQRLQEKYGGAGLQILGISDEEFEEDNIDVLEQLGVTYPCLRYTAEFDPYLNTGYIPDTVFVDSSGKVVSEVYIGSMSYGDWAAIIESLLP